MAECRNRADADSSALGNMVSHIRGKGAERRNMLELQGVGDNKSRARLGKCPIRLSRRLVVRRWFGLRLSQSCVWLVGAP